MKLKLETSNMSYDTESQWSQSSKESQYEQASTHENLNELQILYNAALIIKDVLKKHVQRVFNQCAV